MLRENSTLYVVVVTVTLESGIAGLTIVSNVAVKDVTVVDRSTTFDLSF